MLIQAAQEGPYFWEYVTEEQKKDKEFMIELLKACPMKIIYEELSALFPEDTGIEKIYEQAMVDDEKRDGNRDRISDFERKVRDLQGQRRKRRKEKSVSIIVRDEVTKQERKVDILLAVLLDKRAQLMGYNNYGEQRKSEANNEPVSYIPTEEEQNEIKQITQQIEELEGRETNE